MCAKIEQMRPQQRRDGVFVLTKCSVVEYNTLLAFDYGQQSNLFSVMRNGLPAGQTTLPYTFRIQKHAMQTLLNLT